MVVHRDLREIAEEFVIPALRKHAADAEQYREQYVPEPGTGECEATDDGIELIIPAMDELASALRAYGEAFSERTGWRAPFDIPEQEEEDDEEDEED
ncbi:MAG: hypothetical protein GEV03_05170 [Streptosporangiales bacterium]|nr:hypothetical protein [Streptosporangiales bacterium]